MTREKKELIKKLEEIDQHIDAEIELGCGFTPDWFLEKLYALKDPILEKLAKLSHYNSVNEMLYDERQWGGIPNELPFT